MLFIWGETDEMLLTVVFKAFVFGIVIMTKIVPSIEDQSVDSFEVIGRLSAHSIKLLGEAFDSSRPSPCVLIVDEFHDT